MKKILTLALILHLSNLLFAQAPKWLWAKAAKGAKDEIGTDIETDKFNNVYVTGTYNSSTMNFGTSSLSNSDTGVTNEIFLAKYNNAGALLWIKNIGGSKNESTPSLDIDTAGNPYLVGSFYSPSLIIDTTMLSNSNSSGTTSDLFLIKFNSNGAIIWAKKGGGTGNDNANAIEITPAGDIFMSGSFSASLTLGTVTITTTQGSESFIAKYNPSGGLICLTKTASTGHISLNHLATDASGFLYATGTYSDSVQLGNTPLTLSGGAFDFFVAKFDNYGSPIWAKKAIGASNNEGGNSLILDAAGNVYVTGFFMSSSFVFGGTTLTNTATFDIFYTKLEGNGNILWTKKVGGAGDEKGTGITKDSYGNLYMIGWSTSANLIFGNDTLVGGVNPYVGMFIAKFNNSGNFTWAKRIGANSSEIGSAITMNTNNDLCVLGRYRSATIKIGGYTLTNGGNITYDLLIAKITSPCQTASLSGTVTIATGSVSGGVVELYEFINDTIPRIVNKAFIGLTGAYSFQNLFTGKYLVRAIANPSVFSNAIPTYSGNKHDWTSSTKYSAGCDTPATVNITIIDLAPSIIPGATFKGLIRDDSKKVRKPGEPIKGVGVIIQRRPNGNANQRTTSDANGEFQFTNVPLAAEFDIIVEVPGGTNTHKHYVNVPATVTSEYTKLNFYVDSTTGKIDTTNVNNPDSLYKSVQEYTPSPFANALIYPVPCTNTSTLSIVSEVTDDLSITVLDVTGRELFKSKNLSVKIGDNNLDLFKEHQLSSGTYLIILNGNKIKSNLRIVKE